MTPQSLCVRLPERAGWQDGFWPYRSGMSSDKSRVAPCTGVTRASGSSRPGTDSGRTRFRKISTKVRSDACRGPSA